MDGPGDCLGGVGSKHILYTNGLCGPLYKKGGGAEGEGDVLVY